MHMVLLSFYLLFLVELHDRILKGRSIAQTGAIITLKWSWRTWMKLASNKLKKAQQQSAQEWHEMLKYPWLPRLVSMQRDEPVKHWDHEGVWVDKYVQRMETMKQLGPWSSQVRWSSLMAIIYLLWWFCFNAGRQTRHNEIFTFKFKFYPGGQDKSTFKTLGIST